LYHKQEAACEAEGIRTRQFHPSSSPRDVLKDPREQVQWILVCEMKQHKRGMVWKRLLAYCASALKLRALMCVPRGSFSPGPQFVSTAQPRLEQIAGNFLCSQGKLLLFQECAMH